MLTAPSAPHPDAAAAVLDPTRLAALRRTARLDSAAGGAFDRSARLARRLLGVPVALVSLVDADRQFFRSAVGLPEPWAAAREVPLTHSFCQHVVARRGPLAVEDARRDPVLRGSAAVADLHMVAYLGVPIEADGEVVGSLCAIDGRPRAWSDADVDALADLAEAVRGEVALRLALADAREARPAWPRPRGGATVALRDSEQRFRTVTASAADAIISADAENRIVHWNAAAARVFGYAEAEALGQCLSMLVPEELRAAHAAGLARLAAGGTPRVAGRTVEVTGVRKDGARFPMELSLSQWTAEGRPFFTCIIRDISARREAEHALARSHALLAATLEATADAILVLDPAGRMAGYNRKLLDLWDISPDLAASGDPEGVLGRVMAQLADPDAFLAAVRATPVTADVAFDDVLHFADGRVIERHSQPQRLADGTIAGRVFSFRDVTAARRAEQALRDGEQRLRLALDAARMVAWERDLTAPGAHAFADVHDAVHPEDRALLAEATCLAVAADAADAVPAYDVEFRTVGTDGVVGWRRATGRLVRDGAGRPARLVGVSADVTERKRQEAALRDGEARYRALFQASPLPMWVYDCETLRFLAVNEAAVAQYGWARDEFLAMTLADIRPPEDGAALAADVAVAPTGLRQSGEWRHRTKDGRALDVAITSHPLEYDGRRARLVLAADVTDRKAVEAELAYHAYHDALTGLANRARFRREVGRALGAAAADGVGTEAVAVLLLDLDGFKRINDSAGHAAGDALLVRVAERLRHATRGCDVVARLGGDEFAVLLAGVRQDADVATVAERIVRSLSQPFTVLDTACVVGASVGIARGGVTRAGAPGADPADPTDAVDALVRNADLALYEAKARGKGQHAFFAPAMHAAAVERVALEAALRRGLERGEFHLAYQPVVDLADGRVVGVEALVRWQDPARGLVSPAQFIPLAEETGLVVPLGRWVLEEACRQGAEWNAAADAAGADAGVQVAVNVSGRQLARPEFVAEVEAALAASGLAARHLTLELTESTVIHQPDLALERLTALKALGVRLAIDDFGTGYSALSYLQRFPIDVLKIDKSFVDGVAEGGQAAALAGAIVALGRALRLRTVAEGVERADQQHALADMGCALGQGYLFARPLAPAAVAALLDAPARGVPAPGPRPPARGTRPPASRRGARPRR